MELLVQLQLSYWRNVSLFVSFRFFSFSPAVAESNVHIKVYSTSPFCVLMQNISCLKMEPIIVHVFIQFQEPAWLLSIFHESPHSLRLCSACSEGLLRHKSNDDSSKMHRQMKLPGFTSPAAWPLSPLMLGGIWMLFQSLPAVKHMQQPPTDPQLTCPLLVPHVLQPRNTAIRLCLNFSLRLNFGLTHLLQMPQNLAKLISDLVHLGIDEQECSVPWFAPQVNLASSV